MKESLKDRLRQLSPYVLLIVTLIAALACVVHVLLLFNQDFEFECKLQPTRIIRIGVVVDEKYVEQHTDPKEAVRRHFEDVSEPFSRQLGVALVPRLIVLPSDAVFKVNSLPAWLKERAYDQYDHDVGKMLSAFHDWVKTYEKHDDVMGWYLLRSYWTNEAIAGWNKAMGIAYTHKIDAGDGAGVGTARDHSSWDAVTNTMHELGHMMGTRHDWDVGVPGSTNTSGSAQGIMGYGQNGVWGIDRGGDGARTFHMNHEKKMCTRLKVLLNTDTSSIWGDKKTDCRLNAVCPTCLAGNPCDGGVCNEDNKCVQGDVKKPAVRGKFYGGMLTSPIFFYVVPMIISMALFVSCSCIIMQRRSKIPPNNKSPSSLSDLTLPPAPRVSRKKRHSKGKHDASPTSFNNASPTSFNKENVSSKLRIQLPLAEFGTPRLPLPSGGKDASTDIGFGPKALPSRFLVPADSPINAGKKDASPTPKFMHPRFNAAETTRLKAPPILETTPHLRKIGDGSPRKGGKGDASPRRGGKGDASPRKGGKGDGSPRKGGEGDGSPRKGGKGGGSPRKGGTGEGNVTDKSPRREKLKARGFPDAKYDSARKILNTLEASFRE